MKKPVSVTKLLKRIEELEAKVAELQSRPQYIFLPAPAPAPLTVQPCPIQTPWTGSYYIGDLPPWGTTTCTLGEATFGDTTYSFTGHIAASGIASLQGGSSCQSQLNQ